MDAPIKLPIDDVLGDLTAALRSKPNCVLVAPPGAGKTTRVPLALLGEPWLAGARSSCSSRGGWPQEVRRSEWLKHWARRWERPLASAPGSDSRVGPRTRIEVITEGVFTRLIVEDPSLDEIGAVLFDEYHERSLDADTGLAFALDAQRGLRDDLRLLVMSATLDGARVARLLEGAPVIEALGRSYPVTTRYLGRDARARIEDSVTDAVMTAVRAETGSIPRVSAGTGRDSKVAERLAERITDPAIEIAPLYGAMDRRAQDLAVKPPSAGRRKIVLATSIAESSITIEGVRVVIDSGLARVPRYDSDAGVTRLATVRISRASAESTPWPCRAPRARRMLPALGRTADTGADGICRA